MILNKCPVCNQAGIPDYRIQPTICPQCNSDLRPYMLLSSISKRAKNKHFILVGVLGFALLMSILLFFSVNKISHLKKDLSNVNLQLTDSNNVQAISLPSHTTRQKGGYDSLKEVVIHYRVKKGDCPAKIASFFYNDWSKYKKIETDNNLKGHYTLMVGQSLIIKVKQE